MVMGMGIIPNMDTISYSCSIFNFHNICIKEINNEGISNNLQTSCL